MMCMKVHIDCRFLNDVSRGCLFGSVIRLEEISCLGQDMNQLSVDETTSNALKTEKN